MTMFDRELEFCNRVRAHRGLAKIYTMPKGIPGSPSHCPIATAIGGNCTVGGGISGIFLQEHGANIIHVPAVVASFIRTFDAGHYPELVALSAPRLPKASLPGPSKTVIVEPIETPVTEPVEEPAAPEPVPDRESEPVPA